MTTFPPATRAAGPLTSAVAEAKITGSGKRLTHAETVLEYIIAHPDRTSAELTDAIPDLDIYQVRRRLPDLEHLGLIEKSGRRKCHVYGSLQSTWRAVAQSSMKLEG